MKKILLLGGSAQQIVAIETAKRMGYYTVLCDYLTDNPGQHYADKFYLCSTTDKEAVLQVAQEEKVDGIFVMRNAIAPTTLLKGLAVADGHIEVNRQMETNLKGVFAAGDCTGKPYQYAKAVGEGNVAAHSVIEYLGEK